MKSLRTYLPLLVLMLGSAASASIGPTTPMPGVDPAMWSRIAERAEAISKEVAKANPNASKQQLECARLLAMVQLYRRAQVHDAFRGGGVVTIHQSTKVGDHNSGMVDNRNPGRVADSQRYFTEAAEGKGGATQKLLKEYNQRCGGGGGGGGPTGPSSPEAGADMVQRWLDSHPKWDTDEAYGPKLFPGEETADALVQLLKRNAASVASQYPAARLDEIIGRLMAGRATGQDFEQIRLLLSMAGAHFALKAQEGFVATPARVLPIWVIPHGALEGPFREPKPSEVY